jgi:hypothetical protein
MTHSSTGAWKDKKEMEDQRAEIEDWRPKIGDFHLPKSAKRRIMTLAQVKIRTRSPTRTNDGRIHHWVHFKLGAGRRSGD